MKHRYIEKRGRKNEADEYIKELQKQEWTDEEEEGGKNLID